MNKIADSIYDLLACPELEDLGTPCTIAMAPMQTNGTDELLQIEGVYFGTRHDGQWVMLGIKKDNGKRLMVIPKEKVWSIDFNPRQEMVTLAQFLQEQGEQS